MIDVCFNCGQYRPDKVIDPAGPAAICPECGHRHPFLQLPLLIVAGASGTGKSTVGHRLLGRLPEVVLLEADILWRPEFDQPETQYRDFFEMWLRVCKNVAQSGRPVVLLCSGGIPGNLEPRVERRYFSDVHYLALTCDDEELAARLRARPAWRKSGEPACIEEHVRFNRWLKDNAAHTAPAIDLLDTSGVPIEETTERVLAWIRAKL
ncbi:MAG: AAA family ATPase [Chloroflexi bacterium]|nr:AAA family ATPase [Chloroflexota bacterium]MBU1746160.1 AAA family ATPase [Chloroflexota bacterium]